MDYGEDEVQPDCIKAMKRQGRVTGIFATQFIPQGTRVLAEAPLLSFPYGSLAEEDLAAAFERLESFDQEEYLHLRAVDHGDGISHLMAVFDSNFFQAEDGRRRLFLAISQIRHACNPSAIADWNPYIGKKTVHLLRNLDVKEEVTISYVNPVASFQERWFQLREDFCINCVCVCCEPGTPFGRAHMEKMDRVCEVEEIIARYDLSTDAWVIKYGMENPMPLIREMIALRKDPLAIVPLGELFRQASRFSLEEGKVEAALRWADEDLKNSRLCWGYDSPRTIDAVSWRIAVRNLLM